MTHDQHITLATALDTIDTSTAPFAPYRALEVLSKVGDQACTDKVKAEILAFQLFDPLTYSDNFTGYDEQRSISPDDIAYWEHRSDSCLHPVIRAMYADLVWDCTRRVTGASPEVLYAHRTIDGFTEGARARLVEYEHPTIHILARALTLAIRIKDVQRTTHVAQTIMDYEDAIAEDRAPGTWGHAYELLLYNKHVILPDDQRKKIISDLEGRLTRTSDVGNKDTLDPWAAEHAATLLADHYRRISDTQSCIRVIQMYSKAMETHCESGSPLQQQAWLQHLHKLLLQFGLPNDAQRIVTRLRTIGPSVANDMKQISVESKIDGEQLETFLTQLTDGDFETAMQNIAVHFTPDKSEVESQVSNLAQKHPLQFLFTTTLQDHDGRPIAAIGHDDMDGHVVKQLAQNMALGELFLHLTLDRAISRHSISIDVFHEYIMQSAVFTEVDNPLLRIGLQAYLDDRQAEAIHILIPRIESAFRRLLELNGRPTMGQNRMNGFDFFALGKLLSDPVVTQIFGEDYVFYFRVLLVDQRGWNIRNHVCHGLLPPGHCNRAVSDRLIHLLLVLACVRANPKEPEKE